MKTWAMGLNPFVRGVLITVISFAVGFIYGLATGSAPGSFFVFILSAAIVYEILALKADYLTMFCRGLVLVAVGYLIGRFFVNSFFGVGVIALIYELAILTKGKEK